MSRAYTSWLLDHDLETVWAVVGDFHGISTFVERIASTEAEGGDGPGAVGSVRVVTLLPDNRTVRERLVSYDATTHTYAYEFDGVIPFPIQSYRGTVSLRPLTDGDRTVVEWYGDFDCAPELVEKMGDAFRSLYTEFVADLRAHLATARPGRAAADDAVTDDAVTAGVDLTLAELADAAGTELGASPWMPVDQQRIDLFADAIEDHQWIHVDPDRARAEGLGGTIAHGYLTLAAGGTRLGDLLRVKDALRILNYGIDRVRFPAPVPAGSRVRTSGTITAVTPVPDGLQVGARMTTEVEGSERPACVADVVVRYLGAGR